MQMKMFDKKTETIEDKEKRLQFVSNIFSLISCDPSISEEMRQIILIGSLIQTNLSLKEIPKNIANYYTANVH